MKTADTKTSEFQIPARLGLAVREFQALAAEKAGLLNLAALTAIVMLAAGLRLGNLASLGLANHYYAAAVKSMLASWHNFFYVAAEPGGSVSVDKPPVGLWLQALSAKGFGVTTLGLLLPQIVAGLLSIVLVYHLVRRRFGAAAGLLAGLVLAITPVAVATDRNNTIDSSLIFVLLLAAWAFIKATETVRLRHLMLGAVVVGMAFNIKMLEAYLPLPAFAAMYLVGARERWRRKVGKLLLAGVVILVISLSWALAVDLTPASQRPYVGSSGDNSEISLILGYNGIDRLIGLFKGGSSRAAAWPNNQSPNAPNRTINPEGRGIAPGGFPPVGPGSLSRAGFPPRVPTSGVIDGIGQPGALRLFVAPLSKEASWLLPLSLFGLLLLVFTSRPTWPLSLQHQAAFLWGGWLVTAGVFFSIAGFFHEYYLSTMVPPLAALAGIGVVHTWRMQKDRHWLAAGLIITVSAFTLFQQYSTAKAFIQAIPWLPWVMAFFAFAALSFVLARLIPRLDRAGLAQIGFIGLVAAMLITPAIWSGLTILHPSANQSLPAAYDGSSNGPADSGSIQLDNALLVYLQAHTQGIYYLMAVPSSMQGADYVLATGRPVLYMGGFMGQDAVLTPQSLARLVSDGKLRYIYWSASPDGRVRGALSGGQTQITDWVGSHCRVVEGYHTMTSNFGAPDGTISGAGNGKYPGAAEAVTLYDCKK